MMPDQPQNNPTQGQQKSETPEPVQLAQKALQQLLAEGDGIPEDLKKRLPAFAMQLARSGEEVTVERLLSSARAGELEKVVALKQKQKTYAEIVAQFSVTEGSVENNQPDIPGFKYNLSAEDKLEEIVRRGELYRVEQFIKKGSVESDISQWGLTIAAEEGHLHIVKYFIGMGFNPHAFEDEALKEAARGGKLDVVKYLIEECGADVRINDDIVLESAASGGSLDVVKYLMEKYEDLRNGPSKDAALISVARWGGHRQMDVLNYLIDELKADVNANNGRALKQAMSRTNGVIMGKYLVDHGADMGVLEGWSHERLKTYLDGCARWQKAIRLDPPEELDEKDPAYYRPKAFAAVYAILKQENSSPSSRYSNIHLAFNASGLFGTEDRVLQYLEKWGKAGKQPLHDLAIRINLPIRKTPEMDLAAWGDAVLKCGPSMAKLLKFADRLPVPAKSDDGKTWSMVKTREKVAEFIYASAAENPALAALCMEHNVGEWSFNKALALSKNAPAVKNIPDIVIDGDRFDMPGATFHRLATDDIRGLFLGELTDCCQSIGGAGAECATHGFSSENAGFYVVENAKGRVVGQTWAWRGKNSELVFDSLETLGDNVTPAQWQKLAESFSKALAKNPGTVTALHIGKGGATPRGLIRAFNNAASPAKPLGYKGYRDSHEQVVVWGPKKIQRSLSVM